jgi:hypothetical protein
VNGQIGKFWGPCLTTRPGQDITVRYNPDDSQSILAYDASDTEFIGELWNMYHPECPYTADIVRSAWRHRHAEMLTERASLTERLPLYHENAMTNDRVKRRIRQAEYEDTANIMVSTSAPPLPAEDSDAELMDLLAEARRSMARPSNDEQELETATPLPQSA